MNNKWISVKDRLPKSNECGVRVWVAYDLNFHDFSKKSQMEVIYDNQGRFIAISEDITKDVTHWMPLPEPPEDV